MDWRTFMLQHEKILKPYFKNGCSKCIYKLVVKHDTNQYLESDTDVANVTTCQNIEGFEHIFESNSDFNIIIINQGNNNNESISYYDINDLCEFCLLDKQRDLHDIIFEILEYILEIYKIEDFEYVLQVLNNPVIVKNPKEILLMRYINKSKKDHSTKLYNGPIAKLLQIGIDPKYQYSAFKYPSIFWSIPTNMIVNGFKNTVTKELLLLLHENEYQIFNIKNSTLIMSNLAEFIILG